LPNPFAKKLIEVAESDLKAAEVLLKSRMYPQAVFLIQQALEKAIKAVAIELEVITPEEARKDVGHYIVEKFVNYVIKDAKRIWDELQKKCQNGIERACNEVKELEFGVGFWLGGFYVFHLLFRLKNPYEKHTECCTKRSDVQS